MSQGFVTVVLAYALARLECLSIPKGSRKSLQQAYPVRNILPRAPGLATCEPGSAVAPPLRLALMLAEVRYYYPLDNEAGDSCSVDTP